MAPESSILVIAGRLSRNLEPFDDFYMVDVGDRTVVFDAVSGPKIAPADMADLEGMLVSVRID